MAIIDNFDRELLLIRKMSSDEIASQAKLETECLGNEAWSQASISDAFSKDIYSFFVAIYKDVHVGSVLFTRSFDEADISNVCVADEVRGNNIAFDLLSEAMASMNRDGVKHFTLEVRESNAIALGLYSKLGFESAGVRPGFYTNPDDNAVIMWKHME